MQWTTLLTNPWESEKMINYNQLIATLPEVAIKAEICHLQNEICIALAGKVG